MQGILGVVSSGAVIGFFRLLDSDRTDTWCDIELQHERGVPIQVVPGQAGDGSFKFETLTV